MSKWMEDPLLACPSPAFQKSHRKLEEEKGEKKKKKKKLEKK